MRRVVQTGFPIPCAPLHDPIRLVRPSTTRSRSCALLRPDPARAPFDDGPAACAYAVPALKLAKRPLFMAAGFGARFMSPTRSVVRLYSRIGMWKKASAGTVSPPLASRTAAAVSSYQRSCDGRTQSNSPTPSAVANGAESKNHRLKTLASLHVQRTRMGGAGQGAGVEARAERGERDGKTRSATRESGWTAPFPRPFPRPNGCSSAPARARQRTQFRVRACCPVLRLHARLSSAPERPEMFPRGPRLSTRRSSRPSSALSRCRAHARSMPRSPAPRPRCAVFTWSR